MTYHIDTGILTVIDRREELSSTYIMLRDMSLDSFNIIVFATVLVIYFKAKRPILALIVFFAIYAAMFTRSKYIINNLYDDGPITYHY